MWIKIRIRKHEIGLWFRHGDFQRVLRPGKHRFLWPALTLRRDRVEIFNTLDTALAHPMLDVLAAEESVRQEIAIVDLKDNERALVWKDGRLGWILGPGRHAFWKKPSSLAVETYDVETLRFVHPGIEAVLAHRDAARWLERVEVEAGQEALFFRNGELVESLAPGRYTFWKGAGSVKARVVDRRELNLDVAGQEIMTADKVTLRVNLLVTYQVADAVKALTSVNDFSQALYREAQLVLRAAVGARLLDALLSDKEAIGGEVRGELQKRAGEFGVAVRSVGLRDIILPGEMKTILNQVIEAQKQAEANLIRRREETAAARSQANTARLLAEHPALARMKELEALQDILAGVKATFILGPGDLADQVHKLVTRERGDD